MSVELLIKGNEFLINHHLYIFKGAECIYIYSIAVLRHSSFGVSLYILLLHV